MRPHKVLVWLEELGLFASSSLGFRGDLQRAENSLLLFLVPIFVYFRILNPFSPSTLRANFKTKEVKGNEEKSFFFIR